MLHKVLCEMIDKEIIEDYKCFMGLDEFPEFECDYYLLDDSTGFIYGARAEYDPISRKHKLLLPANMKLPRFLLFHELTHIYDMDRFSKGDVNYDFCLTGYMEYHASQIELIAMMGTAKIENAFSFSMKNSVNNSEWSVQHYIDNKLETAKSLVKKTEKQKRLDGLDVFFNYLGLKSICSMFATDFKDENSYREFAERMSSILFMEIRKEFCGWISDIDRAVALYSHAYSAVAADN